MHVCVCVCLCMCDQYYPIIIEAGFRVILFYGAYLHLGRPYYEPQLWFMMMSICQPHSIKLQQEVKSYPKGPAVKKLCGLL